MSAASLFPKFRKLSQTPINDLIRGEVSGRLDWKSQLADSGLPEQVCRLIDGIVTKAKLWRFEKISVANELISHFQDAFEHGVSFEQVCAEFGDPMVAAQLIHRSKKRNRSMIGKMVKVSALAGAAVAICFSLFFAYFCAAQIDATEDYLAVLNANAAEVDESDRAWPIYREAWIEHDFVSMSVEDLFEEENLVGPESEGWSDSVALIESKQELLESFRQASSKPVLGLELKYRISDYSPEDQQALFPEGTAENGDEADSSLNNMVVNVLLPHLGAFRNASRMLYVDSILAAEQGDVDRVIRNLEATFGMSRHAAGNNTVVGCMMSWACAEIAFQAVGKVLQRYPDAFTDEELAQLQDMVVAHNLRSLLRLEGERAMAYDIFQNVFSDDGEGDGRITLSGARTIAGLMSMHGAGNSDQSIVESTLHASVIALYGAGTSRKKVSEAYDQVLDGTEERIGHPLAQMLDEAKDSIYDEIVEEGSAVDLVLGWVAVADSFLCQRLGRSIGIQSGIEVGIAVHRFQRDHERLPENLDELIPNYLANIPQDGLNGNAICYQVENDEFKLYWNGVDGDDDGGNLPDDISSMDYGLHMAEEVDGDWVLWPIAN